MSLIPDERFERWMRGLEARHLADLTFPEVSRALRALSSAYVERRQRLAEGAALAGAGKRAAFALFYGPLHYLVIRRIVAALPGAAGDSPAGRRRSRTGTSSIWAAGPGRRAPAGLPAVARRRQSSGSIGIPGRSGRRRRPIGRSASRRGRARATSRASSSRDRRPRCWPPSRSTSSPPSARDRLLHRLIARAKDGDRVLIVEPLAGFVAPWWNDWRQAFAGGGRTRRRVAVPGRAAGDCRQARSGRRIESPRVESPLVLVARASILKWRDLRSAIAGDSVAEPRDGPEDRPLHESV